MLPADMQNTFDSVNLRIPTPDGTAYITFVEESPGKIHKIFFDMGKAGTSVKAWAFALAEVVTDGLNNGRSINDMIQLLSNITSSRPMYDKDGIACRSGPEALYLALFRYRNLYKDKTPKVTYADNPNYRPPKLGFR